MGDTSERKMKTVSNENGGSSIEFIRPAALADKVDQIIAKGLFTGFLDNKFDAAKKDIRLEDLEAGKVTVVNGTGLLRHKFAQIPQGTYVEITYKGMQKSKAKSGPSVGKKVHDFVVQMEE